jgi:signal transduction histidine kinase
MSGIGSTLRRHWLEVAWFAFALANVAVVYLLGEFETIPFHFVWVSLTLVYGLRMWRLRTTLIVMAGVTLVTGGSLLHVVLHYANGPGLDEITEVPMMAAMFVAMVFYTERTKAATAAQQRMLERERDFVRDASHELRTPITIARGHIELLQDASTDPMVINDAEIALEEINRLGSISERMLILAAAEHEDFLALEPLEIRPFLERLMRRWEAAAIRSWHLRITADGWLLADRARLELAMDSLIENAVKYTAPGDQITIAADTADVRLLLEVVDEGEGIPSEQLPRIFDRFARADTDRTRGSGGTGLGLAIVKAIAEAHAGTVGVVIMGGSGARFQIVLPGFHRAPSSVLDEQESMERSTSADAAAL